MSRECWTATAPRLLARVKRTHDTELDAWPSDSALVMARQGDEVINGAAHSCECLAERLLEHMLTELGSKVLSAAAASHEALDVGAYVKQALRIGMVIRVSPQSMLSPTNRSTSKTQRMR